jgi:hypothetical protein
MSTVGRIGGAGGIFYTALKNYFGAGIGIYGIWAMDLLSPNRGEQMFGYFSAYLVSGMIGGFVAWLSVQKSVRLLFLIGMFGVQILLTISPSLQSTSELIQQIQPITVAYAADTDQCVGDTAFFKGFKAAFGVREKYDKYAVIVASGKNVDDARIKLRRISAVDSTLKLKVGPRACSNDFYPVIASEYLSLDEANAALEKVKKSTGLSDAYLSPGPVGSD